MLQLLQLLKQCMLFVGYYSNNSYPQPLTPELEKQYLLDMAGGDMDAREKLICHNMRLVSHIAKKYHSNGDMDDMISIGMLGLIKGVENYSLDKGTTLATYLARCIDNEILMTLRSNKRYRNTVYLNEQLGIDSDGNEYTLMDILCQSEDSVFHKVELTILRQRLLQLIHNYLTPREQTIIVMRYGLDNNPPLTQLTVANKLGISRSYISRIESSALGKLRQHMSRDEL